MRIWSLHPKYLDSKGLVALWRETLLAKQVIEGKTKGYINHPQLKRFKESKNPLNSINRYLFYVYKEAFRRGYKFDETKIDPDFIPAKLYVTKRQLEFEWDHLLKKLKKRNPKKYIELKKVKKFFPHPLFKIVKGEIEEWEKIKKIKHAAKRDFKVQIEKSAYI